MLTEAWTGIESEIKEAKRTGAKLSAAAKRTFRNYEQRRSSIRREGLRNDYREVLEGLVATVAELTEVDAAEEDWQRHPIAQKYRIS